VLAFHLVPQGEPRGVGEIGAAQSQMGPPDLFVDRVGGLGGLVITHEADHGEGVVPRAPVDVRDGPRRGIFGNAGKRDEDRGRLRQDLCACVRLPVPGTLETLRATTDVRAGDDTGQGGQHGTSRGDESIHIGGHRGQFRH
jgi:hypothetical protein